ncbi:MAG: hypothetical protein N2B59_08075 [Psychrobacter sp.]
MTPEARQQAVVYTSGEHCATCYVLRALLLMLGQVLDVLFMSAHQNS